MLRIRGDFIWWEQACRGIFTCSPQLTIHTWSSQGQRAPGTWSWQWPQECIPGLGRGQDYSACVIGGSQLGPSVQERGRGKSWGLPRGFPFLLCHYFPSRNRMDSQVRQSEGTLKDCAKMEAGWRGLTGDNADSQGRSSGTPYLFQAWKSKGGEQFLTLGKGGLCELLSSGSSSFGW